MRSLVPHLHCFRAAKRVAVTPKRCGVKVRQLHNNAFPSNSNCQWYRRQRFTASELNYKRQKRCIHTPPTSEMMGSDNPLHNNPNQPPQPQPTSFNLSSQANSTFNESSNPNMSSKQAYDFGGIIEAPPEIFRAIEVDANKEAHRISFKEMFQFSTMRKFTKSKQEQDSLLLHSAEFIRKQLPIRLAKVIVALNNLPYGVSNVPSLITVRQQYLDTYIAFFHLREVDTPEKEEQFTQTCLDKLQENLLVVPQICVGLLEKAAENPMFRIEECAYLNDFIDRICHQRVAVRVLLGQHVALHQFKHGLFNTDTDVFKYVDTAITDATHQCEKYFGVAPKVNVYDKRKLRHFTYIPEHLHHMTFELLKNSMRATCETSPSNNLNDINIIIVDSEREVTIKIADRGGGIPRSEMDKIWLYSYTTAVDPMGRSRKELLEAVMRAAEFQSGRDILGAITNAPMFGLGYGLPVARLYAQYYGGDCKIFSVHGHGTDAYLFLKNLSDSDTFVVW